VTNRGPKSRAGFKAALQEQGEVSGTVREVLEYHPASSGSSNLCREPQQRFNANVPRHWSERCDECPVRESDQCRDGRSGDGVAPMRQHKENKHQCGGPKALDENGMDFVLDGLGVQTDDQTGSAWKEVKDKFCRE